ncbi:MAG: phosphotransferase [Aquificales bacterium]|nr:phosphotransferase [Aquificales bacterium]
MSPESLSMETGALREQLLLLLKQELGSKVELVDYKIGNQRHDYLVLLTQLHCPSLEVVIKLAGPEAPYACPFDRTAALHRLVTAQTTIPMPEVIAVDVSYQKRPWRYMIKAHVPGDEWATVRHQMDAEQLSSAYRQMGNAVAQLHTIQFPAFGELAADGQIQTGQPYLTALRERANGFIENPRLRDAFFSVLNQYAHLFDDVCAATLCHEDLHKHNILFENRQGQWRLTTILDFDKAWAGHHEIDIARLDLWTGMTNEAFWQAYEAIRPIAPLYMQRRPIYQLFWCLEYAQPTVKHLADTQRVCEELGVPIIEHFK